MEPDETGKALEEIRLGMERVEGRIERLALLLEVRLAVVEKMQADHEARLRATGEGLVRLTALSSVGQALTAGLAVLLSALAAWLGTRQGGP